MISHATQAFRTAFAQLPAQVQEQRGRHISSFGRTRITRVSAGSMCIPQSLYTRCGLAEGIVRWGYAMPTRSSGFGLARMQLMISY
jgi:hypothetical protein